jgi:hypothetical protein
MRLTRSSFLTLLTVLPVAYAAGSRALRRSSAECPGEGYCDLFEPQRFRVDRYIRAAVALQSLDRATAISRLHGMARNPHSLLSVIILCRMLFTRRHGSAYAFRAPLIGVPAFICGTEDDWPLWPIEPVDGVPIMIVWGYTGVGVPESDEQYLNYCEATCDWTDAQYVFKTGQQKQNALAKLMSSDKWKGSRAKRGLASPINVKEFLFRQIL